MVQISVGGGEVGPTPRSSLDRGCEGPPPLPGPNAQRCGRRAEGRASCF